MAWYQRILYGVDLDEEQARAEALDAAQRADLERSKDKYSSEAYEIARQQIAADDAGDITAQVDSAFDEGLQEGSDNIAGVVRKPFEIAGAGIGGILKGVPWWVWLSSLTFLAWRLGLLYGIFKGVVRRARR